MRCWPPVEVCRQGELGLGFRNQLIQRDLQAAISVYESNISKPPLETCAHYAAEVLRKMRQHVTARDIEPRRAQLIDVIHEACRIGACGGDEPPVEIVIEGDAEWVLIDRVQIEQVLLNLLRNAREANAVKGVLLPIRVHARALGDSQVEVRVYDDGPGITPELAPRLFTGFVSTKDQGFGIGLSICRTIVESYGGRIWVENCDQAGSCFCFTLPAAPG